MAENSKIEEQKSKVQKTLGIMLDYLGLEATLKVEEKGSRLAVKIASEDAGRIIGRKGQTLDSLQLLLNRIMFRGDDDCPKILLDIDGYSKKAPQERRSYNDENSNADGNSEGSSRPPRRRNSGVNEEELVQQARDAAKEVKRWGQDMVLQKMNAHDRRIIHITLQDDPEIVTQSEGEGVMKKVVISLKKD